MPTHHGQDVSRLIGSHRAQVAWMSARHTLPGAFTALEVVTEEEPAARS